MSAPSQCERMPAILISRAPPFSCASLVVGFTYIDRSMRAGNESADTLGSSMSKSISCRPLEGCDVEGADDDAAGPAEGARAGCVGVGIGDAIMGVGGGGNAGGGGAPCSEGAGHA